ncbi:MAG: tripartite tricarboxylate transporter substrate binding protein [Comamonadaceae bacterium]|nr:MAG: tripartite tricarboxylate transporter substrate binding protein [Comamonadaceae bacterium]
MTTTNSTTRRHDMQNDSHLTAKTAIPSSLNRRAALGGLAGLALAPAAALAQSAPWPSQPVTIVVPTATAGVTDIVGRLLAIELGALWKQPVIVDNKAGASGIIGSNIVARSAKDGYTAVLTFTSLYTAILQSPPETLQVDLLKELTPVSQVVLSSTLLTVSSSFPGNTIEEFIAEVKKNPKKYAYGSYGPGSTSNIYGELIRKQAGLDLVHVPYKGSGPLTNDLLAGTVQIAFLDIGSSIQQVRAGKFKLLATNGPKRLAQFPDVPTFQEKGFDGLQTSAWMGMLLPTGTPRDRVEKFSRDIARVMQMPQVQNRIRDMNLEPVGGTPEHFGKVIEDDMRIWGKAIDLAGVRNVK